MRAAGGTRYLKRLDVWELSPVVRAAGQNTGVLALKSCGCGSGSTCGCTKEQPSRAERATVVADARRILAEGDKILAATAKPVNEAAIAHARRELGCMSEVKVDHERHQWALRLAAWAAKRWGMRPPAVKWFNRSSYPETNGVYFHSDQDSIWLCSSVPVDRLQFTILHEQSHRGRHFLGLVNSESEVEADTTALMRTLIEENAA